jgi:SPASM domain peptide maturase of grasp-with-spasm system
MSNPIYTDEIFVLSSSCRATKGARQSIIVDYLRNDIHIIPNEYYDLIDALDRNPVKAIIDMIDEQSHAPFHQFLNFMLESEFAFLTNDLDQFPEISTELHDDYVILKDATIEIDSQYYDEALFTDMLSQINNLNCDDLQLRILSEPDASFVERIMEQVYKTDINFIELHGRYSDGIGEKFWFDLLEKYATLSKIFLYDAPQNKKVEFNLNREGHAGLLMGLVYYVSVSLDSDGCGVISKDNLSFGDVNMHNLLQSSNGCLFKKLTIDRFGNIKNCLFMNEDFGNVSQHPIAAIVNNKLFQKKWFIKKDDIAICKDCEFRYNCTDCRAFVTNPEDLYSKPQKCGYNPYTAKWEEWSTSLFRQL